MTMPTYYEITIQGQLDQHWSSWFDGLHDLQLELARVGFLNHCTSPSW
jgi:hypothetical protein